MSDSIQSFSDEDAKLAALLCKLDLTTEMVREFPDLQGIYGEIIALGHGVNPVVAAAIREHYLPRYAGDALPETPLGLKLSLMDKLYSLVGFLGIGLKPNGSKDPYALRRKAIGIIRLIEKDPSYDLEKLTRKVILEYYNRMGEEKFYETFAENTFDLVIDFIHERKTHYYKSK